MGVELPDGFRLAWDSLGMIKGMNPEWEESAGRRMSLAFKCENSAAVDAFYALVIQNGYAGHRAPWDAFCRQRSAGVVDPGGNRVELFTGL